MDNLGIIDLYQNNGETNGIKDFFEKTESTLRVETERKETTLDTEWIEIIEDTIQYIDNIFRNPNRFIVNEEEVVKVEQAWNNVNQEVVVKTKVLQRNEVRNQTATKEHCDSSDDCINLISHNVLFRESVTNHCCEENACNCTYNSSQNCNHKSSDNGLILENSFVTLKTELSWQ